MLYYVTVLEGNGGDFEGKEEAIRIIRANLEAEKKKQTDRYLRNLKRRSMAEGGETIRCDE